VVLGMGLGSLVFGGRILVRHGGWFLPLLAALLLCAGYFAVPILPDAYLAGIRLGGASPIVLGALGAAAVCFLPNFILGSLFPWAVSPHAQRAGTLCALNSLGCIAGAFLGGPGSSSLAGLEDSYRAGVACLFFLAALGWLAGAPGGDGADCAVCRLPRRSSTLGFLAASLLPVLAFVGLRAGPLSEPWDPKRLLSGVYQWSRPDQESLSLEEAFRSREILSLVRGREVIVTVELDESEEVATVTVRGNGKVEGSVPADPAKRSLADLPTQVLLGALPTSLIAEGPSRSALLIGLGSGVTLGALLEGAGALHATDVIEIEPAFLEAIQSEGARKYLRPFVPESVLAGTGGAGVRFHFGDARRLLAVELRASRWDAIVSQPSEPWIPGAAPLFTEEFFELASRRLKPGGIFFQWLQLYKMESLGVELFLRTFRRTFPETFVLRAPRTGELILMGSFERPDWVRLLRAPQDVRYLRAGLEVPADRLAAILAGPRGIDDWVGLGIDLPLNTDGRSELQFLATRSLHSSRDLARENLSSLRRAAGRDPVTTYLPPSLKGDLAFRRLLAERNIWAGDIEEALAILEGDASKDAEALRAAARAQAEGDRK